MYVVVLVRRLKAGKTYEDFLKVWYPERSSGVSGGDTVVARNIVDDDEILTIGYMDVPDSLTLQETIQRIAEQEAERYSRITELVEETTVRSIFEVTDTFDLSTDEAVAEGRKRLPE